MTTKRLTSAGILVTALAFSFPVLTKPAFADTNKKSYSRLVQVIDLIHSEYAGRVDDDALEQAAIAGMITALGKGNSYFDAASFRVLQDQNLAGIGLQLATNERGQTVATPSEGGPAWNAGVQAGDVLTAIDGKPIDAPDAEPAVALLRGAPGTTTKLTLVRAGGKPFVKAITRAPFEPPVATGRMLPGGIGYVRVATLMAQDADDRTRAAVEQLHDLHGLVLDLRGNPGGLLPNAVNIASLFIKQGPVVRIVGKGGDADAEELPASGHTVVPEGLPIAVLVDATTASGAEILAGALRDRVHATLIGTRTFGKGDINTVHRMDDGSAISLMTHHFKTPNGTSITGVGLQPDVVVFNPHGTPFGGPGDRQLQTAVDRLTRP